MILLIGTYFLFYVIPSLIFYVSGARDRSTYTYTVLTNTTIFFQLPKRSSCRFGMYKYYFFFFVFRFAHFLENNKPSVVDRITIFFFLFFHSFRASELVNCHLYARARPSYRDLDDIRAAYHGLPAIIIYVKCIVFLAEMT